MMAFRCNLQLLSMMIARLTASTVANNLLDQREFHLRLWWLKFDASLSNSVILGPSLIIFLTPFQVLEQAKIAAIMGQSELL